MNSVRPAAHPESGCVTSTGNAPQQTAGRRRAIVAAILGELLIGLGCDTAPPQRTRRHADQATSAETDHLAQVVETLKQFHQMAGGESHRQLLYHLNGWIGTQPTDGAWSPDTQVSRLPRRFREMREMTTLERPVFVPTDPMYLIEAHWMRSISQWVSADASRRWVEAQRAAGGEAEYFADPALDSPEFQLEMARSVFDWAVRHIQLDELLPYPAAPAAKVGADSGAPAEQVSPPEQAVPGPGYRYYPYQVLLYGHGDAWQRARVFILLTRQLGLDTFMLAVDDRGPGSRPNLWCPAVLIGEELYLFDTALGLPIPGAKKGSVATLSEVLANPDLLRALDVDDDGRKMAYPVTADQLKSIAALIDAPPEALSRRMQLLESRLTGDNALILTVSPSELSRRLRAVPGLERLAVRLWTLPYETRMYRESLERLSRRDPQLQQRLIQEQGLYLPAVMQARRLHFEGQIESTENEWGAIGYYLESRKADQYIDEIATSADARQRLRIPPPPAHLTPQQQQTMLANQAAQYRLNKQHASYWLGLAQYDLGEYETAIHWLKDRTLDAYPNGVWTAGARYNLGRTYEALNRIEDARRLYFQSDSPQRHGDLLRARLLRDRAG